jgi:hypothetical protein
VAFLYLDGIGGVIEPSNILMFCHIGNCPKDFTVEILTAQTALCLSRLANLTVLSQSLTYFEKPLKHSTSRQKPGDKIAPRALSFDRCFL